MEQGRKEGEMIAFITFILGFAAGFIFLLVCAVKVGPEKFETMIQEIKKAREEVGSNDQD